MLLKLVSYWFEPADGLAADMPQVAATTADRHSIFTTTIEEKRFFNFVWADRVANLTDAERDFFTAELCLLFFFCFSHFLLSTFSKDVH